jgi:hypothetical protein
MRCCLVMHVYWVWGLFQRISFFIVFPKFKKKKNLHINCLELLTISIAMKIWGKQFGGKKVLVYCDNEASVKVLNSGFTKDEFMQCCLREICFIAPTHEFEIRAYCWERKSNS